MRKAAEVKAHRVWSYWRGGWWMVDHGTEADMRASAGARQAFVTGPRMDPRTHQVGPPINPHGRFVVTAPGEPPPTD